MRVEELRIGSWVEYGNPVHADLPKFKITAIWTELFWLSDGSHVSIDNQNVQGIPLTPEILEKCGAILANDTYQGVLISLGEGGSIRITDSEAGYCWYSHCNYVWLKHLHQLQNLYHALTGEELNIEL